MSVETFGHLILGNFGPLLAMSLAMIGFIGLVVAVVLWTIGFRVVSITREGNEWASRATETDPTTRRS
jgi:hypothetical protein